MRRAALPLALVLLLAAVAVGCSRPPAKPMPPRSVPLAELATNARVGIETDAINFGMPSSREHLWAGFGPDESNASMTFNWAGGERSLLSFYVVEPRTRTLRLRGWAFPFGDDPPQEVTFVVNGDEVGRRLLDPKPGTVKIELPRSALHVGENFLELRYRRFERQLDQYPRAAGWSGMRFDDAQATQRSAPEIVAGRNEIRLPARTALDWAIELPGGSWLAWDRVESQEGANLEVEVDGPGGQSVRRRVADGGQLRLSPDGEPHRLVGLTLRALGAQGDVRLFGARLHLPDLLAPKSHEPRPRSTATAESAAAAPPPNVIVYLIDALRSDHLGCYGYPRPTSPAIDRFAAESIRWSEARAQASWTRPAVATVLTGLYPITHGAEQTNDRLRNQVEMVSETFQAAGYETAMVTSNGNVAPRFGFDQGWSYFRYLRERLDTPALHVPSAEVNEVVMSWLARRDRSKPFFLYVHTTDPHDPYMPPRRFRRRLAADVADPNAGTRKSLEAIEQLSAAEQAKHREPLSELYDAEIAENDESFGKLMRYLDQSGLASGTAVLLLADHGEEFFEHGGWTHGRTLYEEQLRVPMIFRLPRDRHAGLVLPGPAEQIDVVPTLLRLAGLRPSPDLPGRDLLRDLDATRRPEVGFTSFAWLHRNELALSSVVRDQWKLIRNEAWRAPLGVPPFELYALGSDADERHDLALGMPLRRLLLGGELDAADSRYRSALPSAHTRIDRRLERKLHALGYL